MRLRALGSCPAVDAELCMCCSVTVAVCSLFFAGTAERHRGTKTPLSRESDEEAWLIPRLVCPLQQRRIHVEVHIQFYSLQIRSTNSVLSVFCIWDLGNQQMLRKDEEGQQKASIQPNKINCCHINRIRANEKFHLTTAHLKRYSMLACSTCCYCLTTNLNSGPLVNYRQGRYWVTCKAGPHSYIN